MIVGFFKFIYELLITTGQCFGYDIPNAENMPVSDGLVSWRVIYFSETGELMESEIIEAQSADLAEKVFSKTYKNEIFDTYKVTK